MADLKDIIFTILKWAIIIVTAIVLVLLTIDVINKANSLNTEQVIFFIIAYLVLLFGFFGAYREEFPYALIFAIGLLVNIIYAFSSKYSTREENKGLLTGLCIASFVFAFLIKFMGVHSIPLR